MNAALAAELKTLAQRILTLLGEVEQENERPGYVAVRPTGALGGGVVHWWPVPEEAKGENAWGYLTRMARTTNPETGLYYFPPQILGSYVLIAGTMPAGCPWAEQADRITYHDLWLTQAELDREAEARKEWGEWGIRG